MLDSECSPNGGLRQGYSGLVMGQEPVILVSHAAPGLRWRPAFDGMQPAWTGIPYDLQAEDKGLRKAKKDSEILK